MNEKSRRATILVAVVISLFVAMLIALALVRGLVAQQRQLRSVERELQSLWLAESAFNRAAVRVREDPDYAGETWSIDSGQMSSRFDGKVEIRVTASQDSPETLIVAVQSDFPDDPIHRSRHIGQFTIPSSASEQAGTPP